jgi:hypothetical protein
VAVSILGHKENKMINCIPSLDEILELQRNAKDTINPNGLYGQFLCLTKETPAGLQSFYLKPSSIISMQPNCRTVATTDGYKSVNGTLIVCQGDVTLWVLESIPDIIVYGFSSQE